MEKANKCPSFEEFFVPEFSGTFPAGEILYRKETRCRGTKEKDACSCGGDEDKCDFYPDKRTPKHCPFCGKSGVIYEICREAHPSERFYPSCPDESCLGRNLVKGYATKLEALRGWNKRCE